MYNPTKWQRFKDICRAIFYRHKNTELRTVRAGSDDEDMKVLGRFGYCFDCKNSIDVYPPTKDSN